MISLLGRKILVVGLGISGIAVAKFLCRKGALVSVWDESQKEKLPYELVIKALKDISLIIVSPGVPLSVNIIKKAIENNIDVISEIELAYYFCKGKIVAITGSNGKTTTTTLIGEIVSVFNNKTFVAGNIGTPFIEIVEQTDDDSIIILELSSFQLETTKSFCPDISVILNITQDHLDWHGTFFNYQKAKEKIFTNQQSSNICVLNKDDLICYNMSNSIKAQKLYFSMKENAEVVCKNGLIYIGNDIVANTEDLKIPGEHNIQNVLAACCVAYALGIDYYTIQNGLLSFKGVMHRIQFVKNVNGVSFYNDSKATNPDSAIKGILSMKGSVILIAGGYDKKTSFNEMAKIIKSKVKKLILLGETASLIEEAVLACGYPKDEIILVNSLKEAVVLSKSLAQEGDSVLLSPSCASFDMFRDYEERGNMFIKYVVGEYHNDLQ